jgi:hypothetical protein
MDSSALIAAWDERYPPTNFPKLWGLIDGALGNGRMFVSDNVMDELDKKSDDLCKWLKQRPHAIVPLEQAIQQEGRALLLKYPKLVMERKQAFAADPFVIATAKVMGHIVVTEEGNGSANKPKIPDVCRAEGLQCIKLIDVIRSEAWVF